ncbi:MAG TPA: hypothetical protein VF200_15685 [Woeseiaceae bacterium]
MNESGRERDDELLSAYLDGELASAEADELERRLALEPSLAGRLEAMRGMDRATAAVFRAIDERPMPKRVLQLLGEQAEDETPPGSNVVPLGRGRGPRELYRPMALAASIALAAGLWLGRLLPGETPGGDYPSRITEDSPLYTAFERTASGAALELDGGRYAEPVLTFLSGTGAWCRQLRISGGAAPVDTLACRRDGAWHVELVTFGPAAAGPAEGSYGQASAGAAPAMRAALDALRGGEPPLGAAEEQAVIGGGWPPGTPGAGVRE